MVRPVELQDALGKTPAVERIAQLQKSNSENEQRQVIQTEGDKHAEENRKAVPAKHNDEVVLHREHGDRKDNDKKKREEQSEPPAIDEAASDDNTESLPPPELDITV